MFWICSSNETNHRVQSLLWDSRAERNVVMSEVLFKGMESSQIGRYKHLWTTPRPEPKTEDYNESRNEEACNWRHKWVFFWSPGEIRTHLLGRKMNSCSRHYPVLFSVRRFTAQVHVFLTLVPDVARTVIFPSKEWLGFENKSYFRYFFVSNAMLS